MSNIVSIIGRPNVGKSSLFNRLVAKKISITEPTSGITRDRQYGEVEWCDSSFTIVDTGGYVNNSEDIFEKEIKLQIQNALNESCAILFVVDCIEGLTPYDKEIAEFLRTIKKKKLIVANKADNLNFEINANQFYSLGIDKIFPVSAISGYGTGDLLDNVIDIFDKHQTNAEKEKIPKFSIIGRPNVGKSSFVNTLLGQSRSIVTDISGTTRDSIDSEYNLFDKKFIITDTAGIRKKSKVRANIEYYSVIRAIKALDRSDVTFIMIDATIGLESQDMNLINLVKNKKKGMIVLVNKWDLIDKNHKSVDIYTRAIKAKLGEFSYVPIIFISTLQKQRIYQTVEKALDIYKNKIKKIPTHKLNEILLPIIEKTPPPSTKGKYIKIKYITQINGYYPKFLFFCNLPQYVKASYKNFLENQIRRYFNFEGVPISIIFKKK